MLKYAPKAAADGKRGPRTAKPRPNVDRKALRAVINEQFAKTLAHLAN